MSLNILFPELAKVFYRENKIESFARFTLQNTTSEKLLSLGGNGLDKSIIKVMKQKNSHPVCKTILGMPFDWTPPKTSQDPLYIQHSIAKAHVELIGPTGLVKSNDIRIGLYGMLPNTEYGVRTHPADELYVMLAGKAYWQIDEKPYRLHCPCERSHHPSMVKHANRTGPDAFMSIYVWCGDVSSKNYVYEGIR